MRQANNLLRAAWCSRQLVYTRGRWQRMDVQALLTDTNNEEPTRHRNPRYARGSTGLDKNSRARVTPITFRRRIQQHCC